MNEPITSCTPCPLRATCTQPCAEVERLLPNEETGRIAAIRHRHSLLYGARFEGRRSYVRRLLDGREVLRGRLKRVFNLRYNHGLSIEEIARKLNIEMTVAGTYLRRARRKIRRDWRR